MFEKKEKDKKEKMTESEAHNLLKTWADIIEVRLDDEDFAAVQKELFKVVQNERLTFEEQTEIFIYKLKSPMPKSDGSPAHSIIKIRDCEMNKKRDINRSKNDIDKGIETFKAYTTDMEGEEIALGYLGKIKTADEIIITAVILGFFVQAVPGE